MKYILALLALTLAACASVNDAKRAPVVVAQLRTQCNAGKTSACVDMAHVQAACTGHAAFGGLDAEDVGNCASAVRTSDATR